MSLKDKEKWNAKYNCDDFITGREPSNWLESNANLLDGKGRALDIAAGEGRNSVFAASLGYEVICMDISEIALREMSMPIFPYKAFSITKPSTKYVISPARPPRK